MHRPSAAYRQVQAFHASGAVDRAVALLRDLVADEDADALFHMAMWRVSGAEIRRDLAQARELFRRAGEAGHDTGRLIHCYFLGSGTGGPADPEAALAILQQLAGTLPGGSQQTALIETMGPSYLDPAASLPESRTLDAGLPVTIRPSFLSRAEIAWLQAATAARLAQSMIVDLHTGQLVPNPVRRSREAMFGVLQEDLVVSAINRRIAAATETAVKNGEPLLVLHYTSGGEFRPHSDALGRVDNQRVATALIYLNDDYGGGETDFPRLGVRVKGRPGDALFFRNSDDAGEPLPDALHAGLPVSHGEKWLATRWIRERPYVYPPPTPMVDV